VLAVAVAAVLVYFLTYRGRGAAWRTSGAPGS
jgi:hypothetical protein